jgi:hypothetical protein
MWLGHVFEVCERISEAQAILRDQAEGVMPPDAALERLRALLSERGLHEAMYNIGYFAKQPAAFSPDGKKSPKLPKSKTS